MTLQRPILTSFNAGEISPRMGGRVDTAVYQVAVETLENFVPTVEGPIVKRPGTEYITEARDGAVWLTAFRFSLTQEYVIEWSEKRLRFFSNGVRIETAPGVPYEVVVPYTAAEARQVSFEQSYDRLYLDHPKHPPARLTRTGAATFVYDVPQLQNGPFGDRNSNKGITVTTSGTEGDISIFSSSPIFAGGQAGGLFRIEAADFAAIPAWQVGIDGINPGDQRRNEGKVYTAETGGRSGTVPPTHTEGSAWDGDATGKDINDKGPYGIRWAYRHDKFGIVRLTGVDDGDTAHGTVLRRLPDSIAGTPTFRWTFGLFSDWAGWPGLVKTSFGRLIHVKRFDVCGSVVGDYLNHQAYTDAGLLAADMAFRQVLATPDPPLWLAGDRKLLAGTASLELAIGPANPSAPVTGDNIAADPQSFYGSEAVRPLQAGTSTFFVQRLGRKLREAQYDFSPDRYVAANATVWARHITKSGLIQLAFQKDPEELLLAVRGDGQMIAHPHQPEQDIKGFARIRHSDGKGRILSAVTVHGGGAGPRDELWLLVDRAGARSVERMAEWRDDDDPIEDCFFVDSGVRGQATAGQTHFSGLTHLAGQAIAVLADGGVVPGVVVTATGEVKLPASAVPADRGYAYAFGLPFTATCVTLKPEIRVNGETSQGKRQRLVRLALRLLGTLGITVGAKGFRADNLIDRAGSDNMDQPVPLFSGDSGRAVGGGYDTAGQGLIVSSLPLPATVLAAMPIVDVEPPK